MSEHDTANTLLRRYVYGAGSNAPIVWYEGSGTGDQRWFHEDERGSIVAVTNASGVAVSTNSYDDDGQPATTNLGRFQYTGQAWVPEFGSYYYRARQYHPTLGRFLQPDPIGYGGGINLYAHVNGDPINLTDPLGLIPPPNPCPNPEDICVIGAPTSTVLIGPARPPLARLENNLAIDGGEDEMPQSNTPTYKICIGKALVYAGNPRHVGRTGGMLRPIRSGAAAIIPRQWTGTRTAGPALRSQGALVGGVTGGGQLFSGLDDTTQTGTR